MKSMYLSLVYQLVLRDLKIKYRRSVLGYLWSFLNPFLMMVVLTIVFSNFFRFDINNYPLYLICGQTLWSFLNDCTSRAMYSILQNGALIKKVYIPLNIFPITASLSSFINLFFSLLAIFIVIIWTEAPIAFNSIYALIPLFLLLPFCIGIGMILSALSVYFRDITYLYGVFSMAWMYVTPIFYPISIVPDNIKQYLLMNPMYFYIEFFRDAIMNGILSPTEVIVKCIVFSISSLFFGYAFFSKLKKNFILYV